MENIFFASKIINDLARAMKCNENEVVDKIKKLANDVELLKKEIAELEEKLK